MGAGVVLLGLALGLRAPAQRALVTQADDVVRTEGVVASSDPRLTPEELANIRVYDTVNQSVVNIATSTVQYDFMGMPIEGSGSGSGAILDKEGHILTNQHVIDGADQVQITLASGAAFNARVIGSDKEYDMAVLKIEADPEVLNPVKLGRSDNLRVGQKAYVLGNPFGLEGTLTTGMISSLNRTVPSRRGGRAMTGMVQTDAAMNPGNSGGPLLNSSGEMVGMCVAIVSATGQNAGVGFAIPMNRIRRFLPELLEHGRVIRAYHGIVLLNETPRGLQIAKLAKGGPAENAGLRPFVEVIETGRQGPFIVQRTRLDRDHADLIVAIDTKPVANHEDFVTLMDSYRPGQRVIFTVVREGQRLDVPVVLGAA
ncbi:S1C family serine protease [Botrimarina hoheduenensis]|uniref:S1C family serine protease n=1 Tax=Botrimarina hoheduenensis TaxID=2528000 RepID=UPI0018D35981|nr:trypsin-like peptidase domain-containing protein [Botrimarina hoheduenensis]